jgi:hypothetical protein
MTDQIKVPEEDAFAGLSGIPATNLDTSQRLKIAIVGKQKSGKSWFAAKSPGPVRIYDFDERADSLATLPLEIKKNINVMTLRDDSQVSPTAMKTLEGELSMLKYKKKQGKLIPATYVFDTVTYMKRAMENELMSQMGDKFYRVLKVTSSTAIRIPQGWDVVNGVEGYIQYLITEYSALGNIIFIFHERNEKDVVESTDKITKYTSQYTVDPQYLAKILSKFNDVFRIQINSARQYEVTCKPDYEFNAATTLLVDAKEPPSILDMVAKHRANVAKLQK